MIDTNFIQLYEKSFRENWDLPAFTDLSESTPSGKVVVRSLDTMAPNIYHSPVKTAYTGSNLLVSATVTDNLQVSNVKLYYRVLGTDEWKSTSMNALNSRYTGIR